MRWSFVPLSSLRHVLPPSLVGDEGPVDPGGVPGIPVREIDREQGRGTGEAGRENVDPRVDGLEDRPELADDESGLLVDEAHASQGHVLTDGLVLPGFPPVGRPEEGAEIAAGETDIFREELDPEDGVARTRRLANPGRSSILRMKDHAVGPRSPAAAGIDETYGEQGFLGRGGLDDPGLSRCRRNGGSGCCSLRPRYPAPSPRPRRRNYRSNRISRRFPSTGTPARNRPSPPAPPPPCRRAAPRCPTQKKAPPARERTSSIFPSPHSCRGFVKPSPISC